MRWLLALALLVQVLDGSLTYLGISRWGLHAEGNPILVWMVGAIGLIPALITAKVIAGLCMWQLYYLETYRFLGFLILLYLGLAIIPWTHALLS